MLIFRRLALLALAVLVALSLSRLLLVVLFGDRVADTGGLTVIFGQGLRFDLILVGFLFAIPAVLLPWLHLGKAGRWLAAWTVPAWFAVVVPLAFFVEASSAPFIRQFDSRPNYLYVEYLAYPREVLATVSGMHLWLLIGVTLVALALGLFLFRWLRADPERDRPVSFGFCLLATPLLLVLFTGMIRSTLEHRPVNPSVAAFSGDTMVNTLPLNSPYSVLYAIYEHRRDADGLDDRYGRIPDEEMLELILSDAGIAPANRLDPAIPSLHFQQATAVREQPMNLVMVVLESVGAEHVGALGGRNLTPEFDRLRDQGVWFDRLYATGMRSARGLEAIVSGFTPSRAEAAVKAPQAQNDFFTIADYLRRRGYSTSFIYGGESHFDNMRRFFLSNGFDKVIDQNDFDDPVYLGSWGVSDEDMFTRAHQELEAAERPFFSLLFTSSNHEPFDIPENRVTPEEDTPGTGEPPGRATAIKYSDWALGRFLEQARASSYWDNTLFLVVSDHNARTWGGFLVPVEKFRVPGVIIGPGIEPRRVGGIVSQIDLVPTLLSMLGISGAHPAIGRDLTLPQWRDGAGRAVMQFHGLQALVEDDLAVILQPDRRPEGFRLSPEGELTPFPGMDPVLHRKALAYAQWGPYLFWTRSYRLPDESGAATP